MYISGYGTHPSFDSSFTIEQALDVLKGLNNTFAQDLAKKQTLTASQEYWVHKLATDSIKPIQKASYSYNITNTLALFDRVSLKLKFPKLRFSVRHHNDPNFPTASHLVLARMSNKSKNPGAISVVYKSIYRGCINRDGTSLTNFDQEIKDTIDLFEQDPLNYARNSGQLIGSCMFCGLTLEDERSTKTGYGPICAKNWGLPWG